VVVRGGQLVAKPYSGEGSQSHAVENPLYSPDADKYGGEAAVSRIDFERQPVQLVNPDSIISPQRSLNAKKVNRIAAEYDEAEADPVHLVDIGGGRYSLAGGNHRTTAALMQNKKSIKAHVIHHTKAYPAK